MRGWQALPSLLVLVACASEGPGAADLERAEVTAAPDALGRAAPVASSSPATTATHDPPRFSSEPEFVRVPPGSFVMGQPGVTPATRSVTLSRSFFVQKTPVTQAQWQALIGDNPSNFQGCAECPVEKVSWEDALLFANALSRKEGFPEAYTAAGALKTGASVYATAGYRLPTEAEWEYACRAGTTTDWYSGSDEDRVTDIAWFGANSEGKTQPVARKQPNAFGLYDMSGNVWHWTHDWYTQPTSGSLQDPEGPVSGTYRVIKGGAWGFDVSSTKSGNRGYAPPESRSAITGFRLVRTAAGD